MGFVDIHSHVLYGVDDGARTLADSVAMLELAADTGTTDIVATPHANSRYRFDPAIVEAKLAELRNSCSRVRVHPGCDFHLDFNNIEDAIAHPTKYTINHHSYLMVEFPDLAIFLDNDAVLDRLLDAGIIPIITHPERNGPLRQRTDDIARWVANGCYVQVTAGSFTGAFGKGAQSSADRLMRKGLVHFVASDAHDCVRRPPDLRKAFDALAERWGEERIRPLFEDNPRTVLTGDDIEFDLRSTIPPRRKWFQVWS